jgi:hypothetical protein
VQIRKKLKKYIIFIMREQPDHSELAPRPEKPLVHVNQFDVPHDPLELINVPVLVHGEHGGLYPEQLHALLSYSSVHPEQLPAYQFDVPYDPLELLHVPVLVHVLNGGHGVHGLHPEQFYALLSASEQPHELLGLLHVLLRTVMTENKLEINEQQQ